MVIISRRCITIIQNNGAVVITTNGTNIEPDARNEITQLAGKSSMYCYFNDNPGMEKGDISELLSGIVIYFDQDTVKSIVTEVIASTVFSSICVLVNKIMKNGKKKEDLTIEFDHMKLRFSSDIPPKTIGLCVDKFIEEKLKAQKSVTYEDEIYEYNAETGNFKLIKKRIIMK